MSRKIFLLSFLLSGLTYAIISLFFDMAEGREIGFWRYVFKGLFFGLFMALVNSFALSESGKEDKPRS